MPQIYETINFFNLSHNIMPYKYIGSDQKDNPLYLGSNKELQEDIKKLGLEYFEKRPILKFDNITNRELRLEEEKILKELNVKKDKKFYNKSDLYAPGGGVMGMKHKNKKIVSDKWKESRRGWIPSEETRKLWQKQRTGKVLTKEHKEKLSKLNSGEKNSNALRWKVTLPNGQTFEVVGLRKWCNDNGYNYGTVYHERQGFSLIKYGQGKGGPNFVKQ